MSWAVNPFCSCMLLQFEVLNSNWKTSFNILWKKKVTKFEIVKIFKIKIKFKIKTLLNKNPNLNKECIISTLVLERGLAPWMSRRVTISWCPPWAAMYKGVNVSWGVGGGIGGGGGDRMGRGDGESVVWGWVEMIGKQKM